MLPDTLQPPTQPHALPFTDGEVVLWTERRRRIVDGNVQILLIFSIVLLIIYGLLIWESEVPGKLQQDTDTYLQAAKLWLFVPGLSVCCLLLAVCIGIHHHCTTYVLTNRRGIVVTTPPLFRRQAHATALAPGMVRELKRHRDGTASYMITEQRVGHMRLAVGFEYVHRVGELEALLARYGVKLPAAQSVADRPPTKKFLLQLLVVPVVILCVVCNRAMTEPDFFCFSKGSKLLPPSWPTSRVSTGKVAEPAELSPIITPCYNSAPGTAPRFGRRTAQATPAPQPDRENASGFCTTRNAPALPGAPRAIRTCHRPSPCWCSSVSSELSCTTYTASSATANHTLSPDFS